VIFIVAFSDLAVKSKNGFFTPIYNSLQQFMVKLAGPPGLCPEK
jgi:hypothetical protein